MSFVSVGICVLLAAAAIPSTRGCAGVGGGTDGQIFTDPTLTWTMNPPASWTYPATWAQLTQQYFPGQPLFQADAETQVQGDIQAATLEALANAGLPTTNIRVTSNYNPQMVSDCVKVAPAGSPTGIPTATKQGDIFGIYEAGAITQLATATADLTPANCLARTFTTGITFQQNIQQASMSINGITLSGLQLRQFAAQLQNILSFNYRVRFIEQITFT
ncbi:hypothetical protein M3Y99_00895000 [Aphelenchoides fujianensis]|nr:hypothetical protein M3Y99_00895000 [Aphelenchoides fujianensis]